MGDSSIEVVDACSSVAFPQPAGRPSGPCRQAAGEAF